jgi:hypothetical protein
MRDSILVHTDGTIPQLFSKGDLASSFSQDISLPGVICCPRLIPRLLFQANEPVEKVTF